MKQIFVFILTATQAPLQQGAIDAYTLTTDRLWATTSALLALVAVVIGGLALVRATRGVGPGQGRNGAIVALVAGVLALVIGGLVLATADAGPGSGNGVIGAAVAVILGLIAMAEGGLVLNRSRRPG